MYKLGWALICWRVINGGSYAQGENEKGEKLKEIDVLIVTLCVRGNFFGVGGM